MGFREGPSNPHNWHGPRESFGTPSITGGSAMGLRDGGGGVGYSCGCSETYDSEFGKTKYEVCDDHGQQDCGCYIFASRYLNVCIKHKVFVGVLVLMAAAGILTLIGLVTG